MWLDAHIWRWLLLLTGLFAWDTGFAGASPLSNGVSLTFSIPGQTYFNFYLDVPDNATRLTATLTKGGGDLDLYLAMGHELSGETVSELDASADAISDGPTANERISITPSTQPPLSGGRWFVAVLNLNKVKSTVTLNASYEAAATVISVLVAGPGIIEENTSAVYSLVVGWSDGTTSTLAADWTLVSPHANVSPNGVVTTLEVDADVQIILRTGYQSSLGYALVEKFITIRNSSTEKTLTGFTIEGTDSLYEESEIRYRATAFWSDGSYSSVMPLWWEECDFCEIDAEGLLTVGLLDADHAVTLHASYSAGGITLNDTKLVTILNQRIAGTGYSIGGWLWLRAEVYAANAESVDAVWRKAGEGFTADGGRVI